MLFVTIFGIFHSLIIYRKKFSSEAHRIKQLWNIVFLILFFVFSGLNI